MRSATTNIFAQKDEGVLFRLCSDIDLLVRLFEKLSLINSWIASLETKKLKQKILLNSNNK